MRQGGWAEARKVRKKIYGTLAGVESCQCSINHVKHSIQGNNRH